MLKIFKHLLIGAMLLSITACGSFSLIGEWNGTTSNGNAGTIIFNENGTATMKMGMFEKAYDYEISEDKETLTLTQIKEDGKEKSLTYKVKFIDDENVTLKSEEEEVKLIKK